MSFSVDDIGYLKPLVRLAVVQVPIDAHINAIEVPDFEEFATWYGDKGYS
jgi:hypothetical protein